MAELLVFNRDDTAPNRYRRGDIVYVADDSHVWGAEEGLPNFVVAELPGVSREDAEAYRTPHEQTPAEYAPAAIRNNPALLAGYIAQQENVLVDRRRFRVQLAKLNAPRVVIDTKDIKDKRHAPQSQ